MDKKKLYVGNLPWSLNNDSLKEVFAQFGEIVEAIVIMDNQSGRSKGFGFVTFANEADAEKAVAEMHEKEVEGRNIIVNFAKPKEDRPGGFRKSNDFRRPGGNGGGGRRSY